MKCFSPIMIDAPSYIQCRLGRSKIFVPCGSCPACITNKANEWYARLMQEFKTCNSCYHVTLTYDDDNVPTSSIGDYVFNVHSKRDVQLWLKRVRKYIDKHSQFENCIRYFIVSEYGPQTFRPHYHCILFDFPPDLDVHETCYLAWQKCHPDFLTVTHVDNASIAYVTRYTHRKTDLPSHLENDEFRPFRMMSQGIGKNYLTDSKVRYHRKSGDHSILIDEFRYPLPRYYRGKVWSEDENHDYFVKFLREFDGDSVSGTERDDYIRKFNKKKKKRKNL